MTQMSSVHVAEQQPRICCLYGEEVGFRFQLSTQRCLGTFEMFLVSPAGPLLGEHVPSTVSTSREKKKGPPLAMLPVPTAWIAEVLLKKQLLNPTCFQGNLLKQIIPKPDAYENSGLHPSRAGGPMGHGRCLLSSSALLQQPRDGLCLRRGKTRINLSRMSHKSRSSFEREHSSLISAFCIHFLRQRAPPICICP